MLLAGGAAMLAGCSGTSAPTSPAPTPSSGTTSTGTTSSGTTSSGASGAFTIEQVATYAEPWAMTFLPGTEYAAITERGGRLVVRDLGAGTDLDVAGVPQVRAQGQGGLGDIIAASSFDRDQRVFLSWVEAGDGATAGAVVGAGRLVIDGDGARLENLNVIWRQEPKVDGSGHFSHRLAVSPDGQHLFVSSGDRQQLTPAQELTNDLGKILRLNLDGSPAAGNPFADQGYPASEIWSYGHRNPLGLAFDADGRLWSSEMGPKGGDEINLIESGANFGWPKASNGSHYDGTEIPDHTAGDGYAAPKLSWNPSISPGSLMIYTGDAFPQWRGDAFVGALSGTSLLRIDLDGKSAVAGDRFDDGPLGTRIREVEQAPDGTIWVLQDGADGALLHLSPA